NPKVSSCNVLCELFAEGVVITTRVPSVGDETEGSPPIALNAARIKTNNMRKTKKFPIAPFCNFLVLRCFFLRTVFFIYNKTRINKSVCQLTSSIYKSSCDTIQKYETHH